ncbi:Adenine DNA glycosylase [anaerobic digester metagenome]
MTIDKSKRDTFRQLLKDWATKEAREFSWRHDRTPYTVFVAEFLLKRTTSTAAHRQYQEFLKKYPSVRDLAAADVHDLEELIRPIGLHRQRAKGLKEAAEFIVEEYGGEIPDNFEDLLRVPHIGPYTAACILSFGFGVPAPAVDSNVDRVLSRVFKDKLGDRHSVKETFKLACELVPEEGHELFNYGLIDFGALVCTYRGCAGEKCPLKKICETYEP